ncbi:putative metal-binding motif-containing protein [Aliikangiella sp. G2MR2-5]|uniref:putative metal-binding motif-containing protein n=1 Tax=Aliikangiella sp. G2MR2-5 TaxID=2788943 RepID=UPI0018A9EE86|nr:putative metal-binding motif-containing protein [Aliikangiella sp. G2MR2-5]
MSIVKARQNSQSVLLLIKSIFFIFLVASSQLNAKEQVLDGVKYPQGKKSFADRVTHFYPGNPQADKKFRNKKEVLGKPDFQSKNNKNMVSLGCRGSITVEFTNNVLADDVGADLYVVEVGPAIEDVTIEISENGRNWVNLGRLKQTGKKIDLKGKAKPRTAYRFVKLTDLGNRCDSETMGADIDAIATLNRPIEQIPATLATTQIATSSIATIRNEQCVTADADGDGIDSIACGGSDCDDNDPNRYPGNVEVADGRGHDEDCDPSTHGGRDLDGDGFESATAFNLDAGGTRISGLDCDDTRADVNPATSEVCDGIDNNCDGVIDEGVKIEYFQDKDRDLFGNPKIRRMACPTTEYFDGSHWVRNKEDCDDKNVKINPISGGCN